MYQIQSKRISCFGLCFYDRTTRNIFVIQNSTHHRYISYEFMRHTPCVTPCVTFAHIHMKSNSICVYSRGILIVLLKKKTLINQKDLYHFCSKYT